MLVILQMTVYRQLYPFDSRNRPTKFIPMESHSLVGMGSGCNFPAGFVGVTFKCWHISQVQQNSQESLTSLGHQYQQCMYSAMRWSPKWPTIWWDFIRISIMRCQSFGTYVTSCPCGLVCRISPSSPTMNCVYLLGDCGIADIIGFFGYPAMMVVHVSGISSNNSQCLL